jgi:hypothetical protein
LVLKKITATLIVLSIAIAMEFAGGATAKIVSVPQAGQYTGVLKQNGQ